MKTKNSNALEIEWLALIWAAMVLAVMFFAAFSMFFVAIDKTANHVTPKATPANLQRK